MRGGFTFEERVALWVLAVLLAIVCYAFMHASSQGAELPAVPKALVPPSVPRIYYFAATATDTDGAESDWSKELAWTNAVRARATLEAW